MSKIKKIKKRISRANSGIKAYGAILALALINLYFLITSFGRDQLINEGD